MREFTPESLAGLALKLRERAKKDTDKLVNKNHLPSFVRLKVAAAAAIEYLLSENAKAQAEKNAAVRDLTLAADCATCKCGPKKSCALKSECGADRALWQWRGVQKS